MKDNLKLKTENNQKLEKEVEELKIKLREKEEQEEKQKEKEEEKLKEIEKLNEEASAAKLQLANFTFEKQEEIMKLNRNIKKYVKKLESMGVNINTIK